MQELGSEVGVFITSADQCAYGLTTTGPDGEAPAQKPTKFMTNSPCIAEELKRKCPNRSSRMTHNHMPLMNGRAKAAQEYPDELCKAICRGIMHQIIADRQGRFLLATLRSEVAQEDINKLCMQLNDELETVTERDDPELESARDDVSGAELDPKRVYKARMEEVQFIRNMNLYDKVPIAECWSVTGKAPISTKWIDINKGDAKNPKYRSRNVAREIAKKKLDGLFAATPPLEVMKLLLSILTTSNRGERLMVADVKRAYFHAKSKRTTYVQLPPEDIGPGEEGMCGRLNNSMYGTRDAAANWSDEYTQRLVEMGFKSGRATPCVFHHEEKGLRAYIHGDDFVVVGLPQNLKWMQERLERKYELTVEVLGPDAGQQKEVRVLNRILRWTPNGVEYEADPRHAEIILQQLNISECKPVATPGTREEGHAKEGDQPNMMPDRALDREKGTAYRAIVARANYMSPDRPDIAYAVKELARGMSSPTVGDWCRLKRLARYLKGRPRLVHKYRWQKKAEKISIFIDADWAGDKVSRKSTTGGCIMIGDHLLKGWSKTQTLIALSSGESELYATLKAASEGLGMISIAKDLGVHLEGEVWGDASAALGIIKRRGLGKTRHIDTGLLWVQEVAAERRLKFGKVLGRDNPADLFTKHLDWETIQRHCRRISSTFNEGRAETAPSLHLLRAIWEIDDEEEIEDNLKTLYSMQTATAYEPDEFGLLQPIMCMLATGSTGSARARPKEPGDKHAAPLGSTSSALTPANDPEGKYTSEPRVKRTMKGERTDQTELSMVPCARGLSPPQYVIRSSPWPCSQLSQDPLCPMQHNSKVATAQLVTNDESLKRIGSDCGEVEVNVVAGPEFILGAEVTGSRSDPNHMTTKTLRQNNNNDNNHHHHNTALPVTTQQVNHKSTPQLALEQTERQHTNNATVTTTNTTNTIAPKPEPNHNLCVNDFGTNFVDRLLPTDSSPFLPPLIPIIGLTPGCALKGGGVRGHAVSRKMHSSTNNTKAHITTTITTSETIPSSADYCPHDTERNGQRVRDHDLTGHDPVSKVVVNEQATARAADTVEEVRSKAAPISVGMPTSGCARVPLRDHPLAGRRLVKDPWKRAQAHRDKYKYSGPLSKSHNGGLRVHCAANACHRVINKAAAGTYAIQDELIDEDKDMVDEEHSAGLEALCRHSQPVHAQRTAGRLAEGDRTLPAGGSVPCAVGVRDPEAVYSRQWASTDKSCAFNQECATVRAPTNADEVFCILLVFSGSGRWQLISRRLPSRRTLSSRNVELMNFAATTMMAHVKSSDGDVYLCSIQVMQVLARTSMPMLMWNLGWAIVTPSVSHAKSYIVRVHNSAFQRMIFISTCSLLLDFITHTRWRPSRSSQTVRSRGGVRNSGSPGQHVGPVAPKCALGRWDSPGGLPGELGCVLWDEGIQRFMQHRTFNVEIAESEAMPAYRIL